jgi:DNA-binding HxlR family transcriptional regulator
MISLMVANVGPCIPPFQNAPFGKYQLRDLIEMKTRAFTCGLDAALVVLGGKWKPLILFHLVHGTRRYGELRRAVGSVSDKVLIQQLKELQADGIIDRFDYGEIPPKVEFSHGLWENLGKGAGSALRMGNQVFGGRRGDCGTPQGPRAFTGIEALAKDCAGRAMMGRNESPHPSQHLARLQRRH